MGSLAGVVASVVVFLSSVGLVVREDVRESSFWAPVSRMRVNSLLTRDWILSSRFCARVLSVCSELSDWSKEALRFRPYLWTAL